jgi:hypothetical protein
MHMASTGLDANGCNEVLDSCGCFIFTDASMYYGSNRLFQGTQLMAVALAHEVGHAIGLVHPTLSAAGVMTDQPDFVHHPYTDYDHFVVPDEDQRVHHQVINLRRKIGCETVSRILSPLVPMQ